MARTQSTNPLDRMGVYKQLDDVPTKQRLKQFHDQYEGEDTYKTFLTEYLFEKYNFD